MGEGCDFIYICSNKELHCDGWMGTPLARSRRLARNNSELACALANNILGQKPNKYDQEVT